MIKSNNQTVSDINEAGESRNDNAIKESCDKVRCDAYWVDGTHRCLGCLWFGTSKMKFSDAQQYCEGKDSHLIEIFTQDQKDFIVNRLVNPDQFGIWPNGFNPGVSWAGASRCANGNRWIWDHSRKIVAHFIWGDQKRSEDTEQNHMCLNPWIGGGIVGTSCYETQLMYPICQLK